MKKVLLAGAAIALVVCVLTLLGHLVFSRIWATDAVAREAARPWPGKMGTLESVAELPPLKANEASRKLTALVDALPKDDLVDTYVAREIARDVVTIGAPPKLPDISAMRELLLREPIVWERIEGMGGGNASTSARAVQMTAARALVASALAKAQSSDPSAWEELHAAWKLARSLDAHPQMMAQTASLSMGRMINAVAWKMPLPEPAWLGELQQRDNVQALLDAYQHQTASYWNDSVFPTKWLAASVEHDRLIADMLFNTTKCDVHMYTNDLGVDLTTIWHRAFRFRAEREATANALRVRAGKPIDTTSRCSDGGWSYDGSTLRFKREIGIAETDRAMPLVLRVKP